MDVLVIGGSVFLGRAVVNEALALGRRVTVFNRGRSGPTPPGATQVVGDRTIRPTWPHSTGRRFDLVVDTCGYVPADVARSAELLARGRALRIRLEHQRLARAGPSSSTTATAASTRGSPTPPATTSRTGCRRRPTAG